MRTYSSLRGGGYVVVLYAIEDVMLPYICFFYVGNFTFAKVER